MYRKSTPARAARAAAEEIVGTVQGHRDGHGFVIVGDGQPDIWLSPAEMRAVLHRDRVAVRVVRHDRRGRPEGRVTEILERPLQPPIIGRLLNEGGVWLVAPEDKRYGRDVLIPSADALGGAQAGQVVSVLLTEPPALYGQPVGRVQEVLGEIDDPGMELEIAVRKYGVPHEFSKVALAQAAALPDEVPEAEAAQRVDLRDIPLVTIDGEDARDFDDAVFCCPAHVKGRGDKPNGWRLLVAIADVSHYVTPGSALDADAAERATSVYFPRRVIPMLPEKLSNGLCSLNPRVDRLCMVCDMLVDAAGGITAYQFYPAVMNSAARLTYTQVAEVLTNTRGPEAERLAALLPHLLHLQDLFRALLAAREKRGALDFDTVETEIICDEGGHIQSIVPRTRNDAHRIIEECMLAANVCAADFITRHKKPALWRVHDGPTPEKLDSLRAWLGAMGIRAPLSDVPTPHEFQKLARSTAARPDAPHIQAMLLRSMSQAIYTPEKNGHFGLAYDAYTHFTSPIRRYPDLLVHRTIKAILGGGQVQPPALPEPDTLQRERLAAINAVAALNKAPAKKTTKAAAAWQAAGVHCSACERRADEASRDVLAWLKCLYMKERLGEDFSGAVSAITSFGMFVTLDAIYVDGLVHITELGGEYFHYDEARQELRGAISGRRYTLGTRVRVQLARVDLDGRRIDLRLLEPDSAASAPAKTAKAAKPASKRSAAKPAASKRPAPAPKRSKHSSKRRS